MRVSITAVVPASLVGLREPGVLYTTIPVIWLPFLLYCDLRIAEDISEWSNDTSDAFPPKYYGFAEFDAETEKPRILTVFDASDSFQTREVMEILLRMTYEQGKKDALAPEDDQPQPAEMFSRESGDEPWDGEHRFFWEYEEGENEDEELLF